MRRAAAFLALLLAFALASWLGWWTVPLLGFVWGLINPATGADPHRGWLGRPVTAAALAAMIGWAGWLAVDWVAGQGGLGRLGGRLAGALSVPPPGLFLATLLFPALLAGCAAAIGRGIAGYLARRQTPERIVPG